MGTIVERGDLVEDLHGGELRDPSCKLHTTLGLPKSTGVNVAL